MNPFKKYDLVRIKDLSGSSKYHFPHSTEAIVLHTFKEQFGGENDESMCLYVKDHGEVSWYVPCNLTLVEHEREDLLKEWRDKAAEIEKRESDLDWIFSHGDEIVSGGKLSGTIAETLYRCFTNKSMWGSHGEGIVFYVNAIWVFNLARPFLETKDKEGWLKFVEDLKRQDGDDGRRDGAGEQGDEMKLTPFEKEVLHELEMQLWSDYNGKEE